MVIFDELKAMDGVQFIAGGACQNSMRVAKWVGRDAFDVSFFGCVGADDNGEPRRIDSCVCVCVCVEGPD